MSFLVLLVHGADAIRETGVSALWVDLDDVFSYVVPLVLAAAAALGVLWLRFRVRAVLGALDHVLRIEGTAAALSGPKPSAWRSLRKLRLSELGSLLGLRTTSMAALVNDIFMIRIRALGYTVIYGSRRYRHRIVANEIYDLERAQRKARAPFAPSAALVAVAKRAAVMPTAFWFERPDDLDALLACGQATICSNLLEYISREKARDPATYTPQVAALFERAAADWERLNADPMALLPASRLSPGRPS